MCFLQVRHPRQGLPICLSWRFLAPLALAGTQGCSIQRNDADHAKDESGEDSAVWSGGSFIYVPRNTHVEMPLQAYFRINAENMGQFERTFDHRGRGLAGALHRTLYRAGLFVGLAALGGGRADREARRAYTLAPTSSGALPDLRMSHDYMQATRPAQACRTGSMTMARCSLAERTSGAGFQTEVLCCIRV